MLQDTALPTDKWLAALEPLTREDAFATIKEAGMTAADFPLGAPTTASSVEKFGTGRILAVTVATATGSVYVMLSRDTADEPWHVAWWE